MFWIVTDWLRCHVESKTVINNGRFLQVHRVVVNLCTEYFANLERQYGLQDGMLVLPKDIEYSTMVTIVK